MNKFIVVINGSGGVGKDTFIDCANDIVNSKRISTVDMVKVAAELLGWDGSKADKDRKFLSDIKLLSVAYSDHSYKYVNDCIDLFINNDTTNAILFMMVREPEEIKRMVKDFGAITLLVKNPRIEQITTNMADANVDNFSYDYTVHNDGSLNHLKAEAYDFVNAICRAKFEKDNGGFIDGQPTSNISM